MGPVIGTNPPSPFSWKVAFHGDSCSTKKKEKKKVGQLKHGKALSDEPLRASRGIESQIFVHLTITPLLSSLLRSSFRLLNKKWILTLGKLNQNRAETLNIVRKLWFPISFQSLFHAIFVLIFNPKYFSLNSI